MRDLMVCVGSSCHLQNSREIIRCFKELIVLHGLEDSVELKGSFCMGHCAESGVCVRFEEKTYGVTPDQAASFFKQVVAAGE